MLFGKPITDKDKFIKLAIITIKANGFKKLKNRIFYIERDDCILFIDIQKSCYDAVTYYFNCGVIIRETSEPFGLTTPYPSYDFTWRLGFKFKQRAALDYTKISEGHFVKELNKGIAGKLLVINKMGLDSYIKKYPKALFPFTPKASKYLGVNK